MADGAPRSPQSRLRVTLGVAAVVVVLAALRLPSLFEPAWSTDEGAYANIGRALDLGGVLYRDVWDNKPPGMYWLSAAAMTGGSAVWRMQVALSAIVCLETLLVFLLGRRLASARAGLVAALLFAVVASVPNFTGDQLNAEIAGALPALAAMWLLLRRVEIDPRHAVGAGVLLGAALLFKATFAADVLAGLAVPSLGALASRRRPGKPELIQTALVVTGVVVPAAAAAVALAVRGSLAGLVDVVIHQDPRYAAWGQLAGPTGVPPPTYGEAPSALLCAIAYSRLLVIVAGGAAVAVVLARRGRRGGAVVSFWLACDLAATMVDNRALTHYVQQATPALALAAALLAADLWRRRDPALRAAAVLALPAVWITLLAVLFVPRAEAAVATGHPVPQLTLENSSGRQLPAYYGRALRLALGRISLDDFRHDFAGAAWPADEALGRLLAAHSRPGQPIFVWGELSGWSYALAARLPASRFIWMDSAYRLYPNGDATLVADLERAPPAVLVAERPPSPRLLTFLRAHGYAVVEHTPAGDAWVPPAA